MRSFTLDSSREPIRRVVTRAALPQRSRRQAPHAQTPERTLAEGDLIRNPQRGVSVAVHNERLRIARELHDSVAQTLFGITLNASRVLVLVERGETEQVHAIISDMLRLANDSQIELRAVVQDLRSEESDQLQRGLTGALASYAANFEARGGCQVRVSLPDEPDLVPTTKASLARIAREALRNVAKHAQAAHVDLVLEVRSSDVTLWVTDDGRGFEAHAAHPGHFGLQLMREQAMNVGADLEVASTPGGGTEVRARVEQRRW
jgi:signal transduction histidine kinase